jgi:hypothetical protein
MPVNELVIIKLIKNQEEPDNTGSNYTKPVLCWTLSSNFSEAGTQG